MLAGKCLLIIGGGIEQVRGYELARELGLVVVGSDRDPGAPALRLAHHKLIASTRDPEETVRVARTFHSTIRPIDGVMTLANDVPVTVSRVAKALGLPSHSIETATIAADKVLMKETFARAGVPVPPFREVFGVKDVERSIREWGHPIVVKPVDGRGARGVIRITPDIDAGWAYAHALEASSLHRVIAEKFIPGMQISTESIVYRGRCYTAAWSERNYEMLDVFRPYIIEAGGVFPARIDKALADRMQAVVAKAAHAMGAVDGPVKGDIVIGESGPMVIELAARLSGGYFCTDQIPACRGVDLVRQTMLLALGEPLNEPELIPRDLSCLCVQYFFPEPGRVLSISGYDELSRYDWILKRMIYVEPGDVIEPTTDHTKRAGFVMALGPDVETAARRAKECAAQVSIVTEPLAPALEHS